MMAIPGSSVQKEQGIEDSPAKLAADMKRTDLTGKGGHSARRCLSFSSD